MHGGAIGDGAGDWIAGEAGGGRTPESGGVEPSAGAGEVQGLGDKDGVTEMSAGALAVGKEVVGLGSEEVDDGPAEGDCDGATTGSGVTGAACGVEVGDVDSEEHSSPSRV